MSDHTLDELGAWCGKRRRFFQACIVYFRAGVLGTDVESVCMRVGLTFSFC